MTYNRPQEFDRLKTLILEVGLQEVIDLIGDICDEIACDKKWPEKHWAKMARSLSELAADCPEFLIGGAP